MSSLNLWTAGEVLKKVLCFCFCFLVTFDSLKPHELYNPWNSLGQKTGVDSLSLLQGIFPTQDSNPGLPHCRQILYQLSHKGRPKVLFLISINITSKKAFPEIPVCNWKHKQAQLGQFWWPCFKLWHQWFCPQQPPCVLCQGLVIVPITWTTLLLTPFSFPS